MCFPHIRPYNRHKIDYRSLPCVFLGYTELFRGYFGFDLRSQKFFICRYVRFGEAIFPFMQLPALSQSLQVHVGEPCPWGATAVRLAVPASVVRQSSLVGQAECSGAEGASPAGSSPWQSEEVAESPALVTSSSKPPTAAVLPHRTHPMILRHMTLANQQNGAALMTVVAESEPTCHS